MAKERFGSLNIGDSFTFAGREYTKISDRRGLTMKPKNEAIFNRSDMVTIDDPDDEFLPFYGLVHSSSTSSTNNSPYNPNFGAKRFTPTPTPVPNNPGIGGTGMTAEELEDAYGITCVTDPRTK